MGTAARAELASAIRPLASSSATSVTRRGPWGRRWFVSRQSCRSPLRMSPSACSRASWAPSWSSRARERR
eukprot:5299082-Alexandrium_andersonii.AAC.1